MIWGWTNPLEQGFACSPLVVDDKVFIGSEGYGKVTPNGNEYFPGAIFCIDAITGKTLWISDYRHDFLTSFAYYDDKVFAGTNVYNAPIETVGGSEYTLYSADANSGEMIWKKSFPILPGIMNPPCLSSPAIADGKVFVAAPNRLSCTYYCFDILNGFIIWSYKVPGFFRLARDNMVLQNLLSLLSQLMYVEISG